MKAIQNKDIHDLEIPFDFYTYFFPKEKTVLVEEKLYEFLQERFPLSFDFAVKVNPQKLLVQVKKTKTKAFFPTQEEAKNLGKEDMRFKTPHGTPTFGGVDETPPSGTIDKDGVGWYGEGAQIEGASQNV